MKNDTPKGKVVKTGNEEHDTRYNTYENWDFYWISCFLTAPIGQWRFVPKFVWGDWERSIYFLWLGFRWSKSNRYVERLDWKLQNHVNRFTNMQIDNAEMMIKGPPGGYPEGLMGTPPYDHEEDV